MRKELPSGGGRILGDSSPRIQPGFGAEKRMRLFSKRIAALRSRIARKLAITLLLSIAASFAEYVNLERWGLDINS